MRVSPERAGFSSTRLERITDHLDRFYIAPRKIAGCQVVVARRGYPAYYRSLGLMDIERDKKMRDDTIFRIYSMSKPITSVALMQLYERGMFQLNDPVYRVIPSFRAMKIYLSGEGEAMEVRDAKQPVTFRHLLGHMAGLSYGWSDHPLDQRYQADEWVRGEGATLESFVAELSRLPLRYEPGERWMYSYATDVCGYLVEQLSGVSLDRYLKENIFEPLGMTDTAFKVAAQSKERFAANYERQPDKTLKLIDDPATSRYLEDQTFLSGGGGLTGTTADYLRFCEMLRCRGTIDGQRILGSRTLRMMHRNHLPVGGELANIAIGDFSETAYDGVGFGLGFASTLNEVSAGTLGAGDYYWGGAASTIFWVDPVEDLVAVFMTQLMPSATFNFRGQLKNIIYSAFED